LGFKKKRELKDGNRFILVYEIFGREKKLDHLNKVLKEDERVMSYDY